VKIKKSHWYYSVQKHLSLRVLKIKTGKIMILSSVFMSVKFDFLLSEDGVLWKIFQSTADLVFRHFKVFHHSDFRIS
jgi:hypothetical protein